jgi:hypothetical protein
MLLASRIARFARVPASGFDPATLALTGYWGPDYAGAPWVGRASAGTSGANDLVAGTAPAASSGAADFDGVDDYLDGPTWGDLVTGSAGYLAVRFAADSLVADLGGGNAYLMPCLLSDATSDMSMSISDAGVRLNAYDGAGYSTLVRTFSGASVVEAWWSGGDLTMRVNAGTETTEAWGGLAAGALASTFRVGANYALSAFVDGQIKAIITASSVPASGTRDDIAAWMGAL